MLICIAGKNDIAVETLKYLIENNDGSYELCIVSNSTEMGKNSWQRSLRLYAQQNNINEVTLEQLYNIEDLIFLSLEFDKIVRPHKFRTKQLYNIHFSFLPKYKGMYTSVIPILNGERSTGVTFHKIDNGIDTGDIISQKLIPIEQNDTSRTVYRKCIKKGIELVKEMLPKVIFSPETLVAIPQPVETSTYYSRKYIDFSNITIDLCQTAENIYNQIRAYSFREYQLPMVYGHAIIFSEVMNSRSISKPGTILWESDSSMVVATIDYNVVFHYDRLDELMEACANGDLAVIKEICSIREHINCSNKNGWTPLMVATYNNHVGIVKYLISMGADIKAVNNNGTTMLMYAKEAFVNTGSRELYDLYINLGLDIEAKDYYGKNLEYYCKKDNVNL